MPPATRHGRSGAQQPELDWRLAPATRQSASCGLGAAPISPRQRSVPRNFSPESCLSDGPGRESRMLEPMRLRRAPNHFPGEHSKSRGQDSLEPTTVAGADFRKCPYGAIINMKGEMCKDRERCQKLLALQNNQLVFCFVTYSSGGDSPHGFEVTKHALDFSPGSTHQKILNI